MNRGEIVIKKLKNGFNVIQGDKYSEQLTWDEMLGLVATLTAPANRPNLGWMKTKEEHDAERVQFQEKWDESTARIIRQQRPV